MRHSSTTLSTSRSPSRVGGPSAVRAFTFAISALRAWTRARTSASSRAFQIFSNSDSTWRSSSSAGGSTETFSRRMSFLTHQSGSYDSSRSGRGFPAPGRFAKAPSSWACRICSSNQDSQLTPGGLRSVMSPPTRRGSPLPTSACSMTARTPRFPCHLPNSWTGATNRATKMSSPGYCDPYGARLKSA